MILEKQSSMHIMTHVSERKDLSKDFEKKANHFFIGGCLSQLTFRPSCAILKNRTASHNSGVVLKWKLKTT